MPDAAMDEEIFRVVLDWAERQPDPKTGVEEDRNENAR